MKHHNKKKIEIAGLAAAGMVAGAAAAAYFLYGSEHAKHYRGKLKSWMFKAKGEILKELEKMKDVNESKYKSVVQSVLAKYKEMKGAETYDVNRMMSDLKAQWNTIKRHANSTAETVHKTPKKKPAKRAKTSKTKSK